MSVYDLAGRKALISPGDAAGASRGAIVNVASVAATIAFPGIAADGAWGRARRVPPRPGDVIPPRWRPLPGRSARAGSRSTADNSKKSRPAACRIPGATA